MLTQLPSNKATFTQLVSLFLLITSFCMRRNAQNVYLNLFGSLNLYLNAKSVSKGVLHSILQFYSTASRSYVLVCKKLFLFCTSFSFSLQSPRKQKKSTNTPRKINNIFETIAPHARMV